LGGVVECKSEDDMRTMMVMTGLMGPMYAIARTNRDWLVSKGIPAKDANVFISQTYLSVIQDATEECDNSQRFDELVKEQTPGGLNEQVCCCERLCIHIRRPFFCIGRTSQCTCYN
jgi:pyrroline-5-carboxylate reductase